MPNTQDMSKFGYVERKEAGLLLSTYAGPKDKTRRFASDGVTVEFNPNSGNVFLVDEDYNVAMMEDDELVDFLNCGECGHEGTPSEFSEYMDNDCCKEFYKDYKGD
jgi:hypothetical protein